MAYRVLLMDDEPAICEISGILLKKLGYEPVIAVSGEEALTQYKNARDSGKPFDVIILDLTIPGGMGGREVVSAIRESDSDVKILVSSGDLSDPAITSFADFGFSGVLAKPYRGCCLTNILKNFGKYFFQSTSLENNLRSFFPLMIMHQIILK